MIILLSYNNCSKQDFRCVAMLECCNCHKKLLIFFYILDKKIKNIQNCFLRENRDLYLKKKNSLVFKLFF